MIEFTPPRAAQAALGARRRKEVTVRKYILLLMIFCLCLSLISCNDARPSNTEPNTNTEETKAESDNTKKPTDNIPGEIKIEKMFVTGFFSKVYQYREKEIIEEFFEFFKTLETVPLSKEESDDIRNRDGHLPDSFVFEYSDGSLQYVIINSNMYIDMVGEISTNGLYHIIPEEKMQEISEMLNTLPLDEAHEAN